MGWYRVHLHCAFPNPVVIAGDSAGGFYTTRFVEAAFDRAAVDVAIERLRDEPKYQRLHAQLAAEPRITAEDVEAAEQPASNLPLHGYAFYLVDRG